MRHLNGLKKFNRTSSHRLSMLGNMATSLLRYEKITTTDVKAKALKRIVERLITLSKRVVLKEGEELSNEQLAQRVHAIRLAKRWVKDKEILTQLFTTYSNRYQSRAGGYTRIVKVGFRAGDNAPLSLIQLLPADYTSPGRLRKTSK